MDNDFHERSISQVVRLELDQRMQLLDIRLKQGAETFAKFDERIGEVEKLTRMPLWKVLAGVTAAGVAIVSWVWQAARYPDREEWNQAIKEQSYKMDRLREEIGGLRIESIQMRGSVNELANKQIFFEQRISGGRNGR